MDRPDSPDLLALLPRATTWALARAGEVQRTGRHLSERGIGLARSVGVTRPEQIRVAIVARMPPIEDPVLSRAAIELDVLGPGTHGLTLGYCIYFLEGRERDDLLFRHECRHVYQYERAGSIEAFLRTYLQQLAEHGYEDAPLERDARAWERV